MRMKTTFTAAVLALGLAGCDEGTTGPGGDASMQVAARGDTPGAASRADGGAAYSQALGTAEGTVDFRARVYVRTDAGAWLELTERAAEQATVDAAGRAEAELVGRARVEATHYDRVRVVFEDVDADVRGGIVIGAGLLTGAVTVDLRGDNQVVVERSVDVDVAAGGSARLLIDLNADAWLNQASAQSRTVSETAFESAVRVTATSR
ncbi:MAG TPA: DUF4382 domain-containing protein [Longimicrobiaceae bacterium]|jgi:hypothetical protein